jgi:hypothetical protein
MGINYSSYDYTSENQNFEDIQDIQESVEITYEEGTGIIRKDSNFNPILEGIDEIIDKEPTKINQIIDKYNIEIPKKYIDNTKIKKSNSYNSLATTIVKNIIEDATHKIILEKSIEINEDKIKIGELETQLSLISEKYNELYTNHKKTLSKYNRLKRKYKFD